MYTEVSDYGKPLYGILLLLNLVLAPEVMLPEFGLTFIVS
uniref:Uncharacterized protein n=2 Tax=Aegilops tauschii TaxID=37682 RepID=A0A453GHB9_AEGTS